MPDDQSMPVYAVYRSEGADRNDLVLGSLYRSTCPPQAGAAPLAVGQVELGTTPVPFSPAPAPADAGADAPPVAGGDGAAADIVGAADAGDASASDGADNAGNDGSNVDGGAP
jgi:hypothetical protein